MILASGTLIASGRPTLASAQLNTLRTQEPARAALALERLNDARATMGLGAENAFESRRTSTDAFGTLHAHIHQIYRGVPVWGGDAILHMDAENTSLPATDKLIRGLDLAVNPALEASEALAIAQRDMKPKGALSSASAPELVVVPRISRSIRAGVTKAQANAADVITTVTGGDLAYHIHLETRSQSDTRSMDYLVSALDGTILKKWSSLETAGATGTGNTQYSGTVSVSTNTTASGYEMRDTLRGSTIVTDMANAASSSMGTIYTDADNTWGNGQNFYDDGTSGSTSSATGQTAAVDAKFGFQSTWDYYKNVHGRNGIDNTGKATTLRMHYASFYDNAFWSDSCFCMTFGDGGNTSASPTGDFNNLTAIDVIGHELSHGVIANSVAGGLDYSGESGGLNEADSDINGTFVTYYGYNGGTGSTVPNTIPSGNLHGYTPWTIGSQLSNPPLRYMYKPSLDKFSPDAWYFDVGQLDPHAASGPMNRCMYFLAQGASATSTADSYTSYLPSGMTGIGNNEASAIWYYVMTNELTSAANYHDARIGAEAAATALYGNPSTELAAVQNAFHGINVGPAAGGSDDTQAPTGVGVSEAGSSGTVTLTSTGADNVGITRVDFSIDGIVMAQSNAVGDAVFDSHLLGNGTHSLFATAYDDYHNSATSSTISFTTLNSYAQFLVDPGFEQGGVNWRFFGQYARVTNNATYAHSGTNYAVIGVSGVTGEYYCYQTVTLPASTPKASLTFWTRISNTSHPTTSTSDTMEIAVYDSTLNTKLQSLQTLSGKDATGAGAADSSWKQVGPFDLSAFKGQTVNIVFDSICNAGLTSFRLDDAALNTQYAEADENGDGSVDGIDLGLFAKDYGSAAPLSDLNNDGVVNDSDATILLNAFGH